MNIRVPPLNSTIVKAHTFATRIVPLNSGQNTPINSQPSSPMRKDMTSFTFQDIQRHSFTSIKRESGGRVQKLLQDRTQVFANVFSSRLYYIPIQSEVTERRCSVTSDCIGILMMKIIFFSLFFRDKLYV